MTPLEIERGMQRVRKAFESAETIFLEKPKDSHANFKELTKSSSFKVKVSNVSGVSKTSTVSGMSVSPFIKLNWSDIERDAFGERAAILEFDAGYERGRAEYMARRFMDELASSGSVGT